ncbi:Ankyrin repeat protein 1 [Giardia muris]|uniref:Ankyrin repeat protein 1 n=1 Tax=Giardia muris TaxID=5742 RepID=A0A4Z1SZX7_GIAMU|nr:Ankyrin repeat protein 1 [Giardia muris]|eukprot:TNJ30295.1 Ankyrin repeat protein 1 [Giardia muris]
MSFFDEYSRLQILIDTPHGQSCLVERRGVHEQFNCIQIPRTDVNYISVLDQLLKQQCFIDAVGFIQRLDDDDDEFVYYVFSRPGGISLTNLIDQAYGECTPIDEQVILIVHATLALLAQEYLKLPEAKRYPFFFTPMSTFYDSNDSQVHVLLDHLLLCTSTDISGLDLTQLAYLPVDYINAIVPSDKQDQAPPLWEASHLNWNIGALLYYMACMRPVVCLPLPSCRQPEGERGGYEDIPELYTTTLCKMICSLLSGVKAPKTQLRVLRQFERSTEYFDSIKKGDLEAVQRLANTYAEARDRKGWTGLMTAVFFRQKHVAKILLDKQAGLRVEETKETALMLAAKYNLPYFVEMLVEKEGGMQDHKGLTALMHGVLGNAEECIAPLALKEVRVQDDKGFSALMYAVMMDIPDIALALAPLERGLRDNDGNTALSVLVSYKERKCTEELAKMLLECEKEISLNKGGETPLMIAIFNHSPFVSLLESSQKEAQSKAQREFLEQAEQEESLALCAARSRNTDYTLSDQPSYDSLYLMRVSGSESI